MAKGHDARSASRSGGPVVNPFADLWVSPHVEKQKTRSVAAAAAAPNASYVPVSGPHVEKQKTRSVAAAVAPANASYVPVSFPPPRGTHCCNRQSQPVGGFAQAPQFACAIRNVPLV